MNDIKPTCVYVDFSSDGENDRLAFDLLLKLPSDGLFVVFGRGNHILTQFCRDHALAHREINLDPGAANANHRGGIFRRLRRLVGLFVSNLGFEELGRCLALLAPTPDYHSELEELAVEYSNLLIVGANYPGSDSAWSLARGARRLGFSRVYMTVPGFAASRGLRVLTKTFPGLIRWWSDRLLRESTTVFVAPTQEIRRQLISRHRFAAARVEVIHSGVKIPESMEKLQNWEPVGLARSFERSEDFFELGGVGVLSKAAGYQDLLEALVLLQRRQIPFRMVLAGEGPALPQLQASAAKLGLENVYFWGFQPDVSLLYRWVDLFVTPDTALGLNYSAAEAMSFGVPIVGPQSGGMSEMITSGETGWLWAAGDPLSLANCLEDAFRIRANLVETGSNARRRAEEKLDLNQMAERFSALLSADR